MLISVHIPKTGGTSFGQLLRVQFGERLYQDYGDWVGYNAPEAVERRALRRAEMLRNVGDLGSRYDCIHGHFNADKYAAAFPSAHLVAFFREPYQQAVSNYEYLVRNPQIDHPVVRTLHEHNMTLVDYLEWSDVANVQTSLLGAVALEDFTVVGLTESFARSVAAANAILGLTLGDVAHFNVNTERKERPYPVDPAIMAVVSRTRSLDIDLYRRACEVFDRRMAKFAEARSRAGSECR